MDSGNRLELQVRASAGFQRFVDLNDWGTAFMMPEHVPVEVCLLN
jgi:hypothetical protein